MWPLGLCPEYENKRADANENSKPKGNDFVILKLGIPLEFDTNVQPACLPNSDHFSWNLNESYPECFTSGWGTTSSGKEKITLLV